MLNSIEILVPIYKTELTDFEITSLSSAFRVFKNYIFVMFKPESLITTQIEKSFCFDRIETFNDSFFDSIESYNRLMLSPQFYQRFLSSDYILILQPDVYVFKDELAIWINKGYDYVGAPWVSRSSWSKPYQFVRMLFMKLLGADSQLIFKYDAINKVGNGGFSLRKTATHFQITTELEDEINFFLNNQSKVFFNEDLYLSIKPQKRGYSFKIPNYKEAVSFAFDLKPDLLLRLNKGELPMACHGWYSMKNIRFWKPIIEIIERNKQN